MCRVTFARRGGKSSRSPAKSRACAAMEKGGGAVAKRRRGKAYWRATASPSMPPTVATGPTGATAPISPCNARNTYNHHRPIQGKPEVTAGVFIIKFSKF